VIIRELQDFSRSPKVNVRQVMITLLLSFCKQSKNAYQEHLDDLIRISITLLSDENEQVLNLAWDCVDCMIKVSRSQGIGRRLHLIFHSQGYGSIGIAKALACCSTSTSYCTIKHARTRPIGGLVSAEEGESC
jgi:hypothetical protein